MIRTSLTVLMLSFLLAATAQAQVQVSASVNRDRISQAEAVELSITVEGSAGAIMAEPTLPDLSDFEIVGIPATSQQMSVINGTINARMVYTYTLAPTRAGKLRIGAVSLKVGGRTYNTTPITVTVTSGGTRSDPLLPQPGNPFDPGIMPPDDTSERFLAKQSVDHQTAYVGQQITYTFSFFQGDQLFGDADHTEAETPGFVALRLPETPSTSVTVNNRPYTVHRRLKALFPTTPGKHTIGEASVAIVRDPLLGREELIAKPITINVLPLPTANQPAGFEGAIGSFTVSVSADRQAVRAGETVNCTVEVRGTGNIRSLGPPQLAVPSWVRVYQGGEKRDAGPGRGGPVTNQIGGTAVFTVLLLPKQAGNLTIPSAHYPYFDPETRSYRSAESQPIQVAVTPGSAVPDDRPLQVDQLRPLKAKAGCAIADPITRSPWFWLLQMISLAAVLWAGWQRWQEHRLVLDPDAARAGNALGLARRRFDLAGASLAAGNADAFYAEMNAALIDYVADRTGAPPSGLTSEVAQQLLVQHGADAALAGRTQALLERTAAGRFAPGGADPATAQRLADEARDLVAALQRQVKRNG